MTQPLPPGQNPVDPRGAFGMPPVPGMPGMPPPGMIPPGPMIYPMPSFAPPLPRRGGKWALITFLVIALIVSVMFNIIQLAIAVAGSMADVKQTVVSGEGSDKIAVVGVDGIIDDETYSNFDTVLKEVEKDSAVKGLVVEVDTPGGSASASDEMYHRLDQFKSAKKVPVVIAMRGMATSGGYYVSAAGDYIFAEPGCLTGNIGVLFPRFNASKLVNEYGIYENTLTATTIGHSYKNAGSMFQPDNPQDEAYLQGLVDGIFVQFKQVVQTGRKGKLSDAAGDVFSGKAFMATDALTRGLIDQIGYPDAAYDYAAKLAGITSKQVVKYSPNVSLLQLLSTRSNLPEGQTKFSAHSLGLDGLTIDGKSAADLIYSRPLLLWRGN